MEPMPLVGPPLATRVDLPTVLQRGLAANADAPAIVSAEGALSWQALDEASTTLAINYCGMGLRAGDRVASLMPNRIALATHYLACFKAGLVATPLNYRYAAREVDHALEVSEAALLVAHAERAADLDESRLAGSLRAGVLDYGAAEPGPRSLEVLTAGAVHPLDTAAFPAGLPAPDPEAPAAIFFTSGSTGPAKGVTHSLETLGWALASAAAAFELTEDDAFLPASSMSHIGSFLWTFASLAVGARVVVARTFDAHEVFTLLRAERPTVMAMMPAALTALVRDHGVRAEDFSSLRLCRAGADKVSLQLEREFTDLVGFPIDEGYGMSEVGLASLNPPSGVIKQGSVGRPIPAFQFSLRDEEGGEVAVGEVGRVWMKSPSATIGYWENEEATAEIMADGWLDSGDLMRRDEDGYLWFFGRKKQIIVHDGSNISPFEVEGALVEHPAVALACVVGVQDEVHGESVRAYVTLKPDAARPTSHDLIEFARREVTYKAPEEIVFLDEMPLNPTGKLDRVAIKAMAEDHLNPHL